MLAGWMKNGLPASQVSVVDPSPPPTMAAMLDEHGISSHPSADDLGIADIILVAVKPQIMDAVLPTIKGLVGDKTLVTSVAAGRTIASMTEVLGECACIRVMSNTPSLIGKGMTACYANDLASQKQRDETQILLEAIGSVAWVDSEAQIDAVTAVSGSGPAYVFHLAECMAQAGIDVGLPVDLAMTLAKETIFGAGALMRESENPPSTLRENVTSPNGTTAAALEVLMAEGGMQPLMQRAIAAANKRAQELSG